MPTTLKALIESKFAESAETLQYTSDNCKTAIDKFTAVNTGAANATLTIHLVPAGGTAGPANAFTKTLTPGASWPFPDVVGHNMEPGDFISTIGSTATISIRSSGRLFT